MKREQVYELLERKYKEYNSANFIANDPISVPHRFTKLQDIEIIGFWIAMLAWGNRKGIINSGNKLVELMDGAPHDFILNHKETDLKRFLDFKHRTFNATDALYFIEVFKQHYSQHDSLETMFFKQAGKSQKPGDAGVALASFHENFFSLEDAPHRTRKHIATPLRGSTCKRMNMFLRWMVRKDKHGVDFGLWKKIKPSELYIPLDVHVDRTARKLGLIRRKQTDWETVVELTENLKQFDPKDPVKYDFSLFGISVLDKMEIH
ncbi:MAG TPA: TIGR02757 family protein [Chitinophagales bacterium]|nr:TIGR02757 family protein [Chitinophagales bacterium]